MKMDIMAMDGFQRRNIELLSKTHCGQEIAKVGETGLGFVGSTPNLVDRGLSLHRRIESHF